MRTTFDGFATSDELRHHGILGMKWGVRRTPEELGHKPKGNSRDSPKRMSRKERKAAEAAAKAEAARKEEARIKMLTRERVLGSTDPREIYEHRHELSTNELRDATDRVRYANQLKEAMASQSFKAAQEIQNKQSKGKEMTDRILKKLGDATVDVAGSLAKSGLEYGSKELLNKLLGEDKAKQIYDPSGYKTAKKNAYVQKNLDDIIDNPGNYSDEYLSLASTRMSTITSLSSYNKKLMSESTLSDMVNNPEKYSPSDLAAAAKQAGDISKIFNRKTVTSKSI